MYAAMADVDEDPNAEGGAPSSDDPGLKEEKDDVPDECADKENVSEPVPVVEGGQEGERVDGGGIEASEGAVEGEESVGEGDGGDGAEGDVCEVDEGEAAVCDEIVSYSNFEALATVFVRRFFLFSCRFKK